MNYFLVVIFLVSFFSSSYLILESWSNRIYQNIEKQSKYLEKKLEKEFIKFSYKGIIFIFLLFILSSLSIFIFSHNSTYSFAYLSLIPLILFSILKLHSRIRRKKVIEQLPTLLDIIEGYLKAGFSFHHALNKSCKKLKSPIREELKVVEGNIQIGIPADEALRSIYERIGGDEALIIFITISNSIKHGSNVSEMISNVKFALLEKRKMEKKLRAQTSQGKLQGVVLSIVPILLVGCLNIAMPGYFTSLVSSSVGIVIIFTSITLLTLGWILIFLITRPRF